MHFAVCCRCRCLCLRPNWKATKRRDACGDKLARPLGHFVSSLIGLKRIIFRNVFQRVLRAILDTLWHT